MSFDLRRLQTAVWLVMDRRDLEIKRVQTMRQKQTAQAGHTENETVQSALRARLRNIVGAKFVLIGEAQTRRYRNGYRFGGGAALAVVRPGSLVEMWRVISACHAAGTIVLCQAANTGLTGGSTPVAQGYDRPVVIISVMRLRRLDVIGAGEQILSHPGVTLDQLERVLKPLGREPHSVIGSSCIGASVIGGLCNNSGGALVRRGPAFTQLAIYAQVDAAGELALVNHLGIKLGNDPEEMLSRLDRGDFSDADIATAIDSVASDHEYCDHVRDISAATPARYNADPRRLYEVSGCAGKLAVFAVRLDTFVADDETKVFYIGSNDPAELETIRRDILSDFVHLPVAGEYMHRDAYGLSRRYGKDLFLYIKTFGTEKVPLAFALKSRFDAFTEKIGFGNAISDRLLQFVSKVLPSHLPPRLDAYHSKFEHHLLLKMADGGIEEARSYLSSRYPTSTGEYIECDEKEAQAAFLNRFTIGGALVRYRAVNRHKVEDIVALDVALPRNTIDWFERLPASLTAKIDFTMYCGHFFCHVLHQEYLVKKGEDCERIKTEVLSLLNARGAAYPAEHNVGHSYDAAPTLKEFYRSLDPTNTFNPGIGHTSLLLDWKEPGSHR